MSWQASNRGLPAGLGPAEGPCSSFSGDAPGHNKQPAARCGGGRQWGGVEPTAIPSGITTLACVGRDTAARHNLLETPSADQANSSSTVRSGCASGGLPRSPSDIKAVCRSERRSVASLPLRQVSNCHDSAPVALRQRAVAPQGGAQATEFFCFWLCGRLSVCDAPELPLLWLDAPEKKAAGGRRRTGGGDGGQAAAQQPSRTGRQSKQAASGRTPATQGQGRAQQHQSIIFKQRTGKQGTGKAYQQRQGGG